MYLGIYFGDAKLLCSAALPATQAHAVLVVPVDTQEAGIWLVHWESQARMSRTGLWALPDPEKPWEWRRKRRIGAM
nr:unnamed protein product [Digitaria exilis]